MLTLFHARMMEKEDTKNTIVTKKYQRKITVADTNHKEGMEKEDMANLTLKKKYESHNNL